MTRLGEIRVVGCSPEYRRNRAASDRRKRVSKLEYRECLVKHIERAAKQPWLLASRYHEAAGRRRSSKPRFGLARWIERRKQLGQPLPPAELVSDFRRSALPVGRSAKSYAIPRRQLASECAPRQRRAADVTRDRLYHERCAKKIARGLAGVSGPAE